MLPLKVRTSQEVSSLSICSGNHENVIEGLSNKEVILRPYTNTNAESVGKLLMYFKSLPIYLFVSVQGVWGL